MLVVASMTRRVAGRHFSTSVTRAGLTALLDSVAAGKTPVDEAVGRIRNLEAEEIGGYALIDHHRTLRTGFPEVVFGDGKTPDQVADILASLQSRGHPMIMATRVTPEAHETIRSRLPQLVYYDTARICALIDTSIELEKESETNSNPEDHNNDFCDIETDARRANILNEKQPALPMPTRRGNIAVLAAGTCDLPVAEEAVITARLYGFNATRLYDVGVAGLHRLLSQNSQQVMQNADVIIVTAGMEGALPSVVAGLVGSPVVAVPTSIGYGASFAGLTPLLTMLSSCAPGIGVVNIDNGFGAAALACQILRVDPEN